MPFPFEALLEPLWKGVEDFRKPILFLQLIGAVQQAGGAESSSAIAACQHIGHIPVFARCTARTLSISTVSFGFLRPAFLAGLGMATAGSVVLSQQHDKGE